MRRGKKKTKEGKAKRKKGRWERGEAAEEQENDFMDGIY